MRSGQVTEVVGLNPCYTGIYSTSRRISRRRHISGVLILVILEYTLRGAIFAPEVAGMQS